MKDISKIDWHFWHKRKRTPLFLYTIIDGAVKKTAKDLPIVIDKSGSIVDWMVSDKKELQEHGKQLWSKFKEKPNFILDFMHDEYKLDKIQVTFWKKLGSEKYKDINTAELLGYYQKFIANIIDQGQRIWTPLSVEHFFEQDIKNILGEGEDYNIIMTPVKNGLLIEERISLLNIAINLRLGNDVNDDLKKHIEKFSFLKKKGMFMEFFDRDHYEQKIEEIREPERELEKIKQENSEKIKKFQDILTRYDKNKQILFKTANEAAFFRSWRTERLEQPSFYAINLFKEISKRIELDDYHDLLYLLPEEVKEMLEGNEKIKERIRGLIAERKEAFIIISFGAKDKLILQGPEAKKLFNKIRLFEPKDGEVKGDATFKGKVKGKVIIVNGSKDYKKMMTAEVIVTHTTIPEMVPYLKNVKAIITEEGGILSHAAVISREFKIPAVIGTKIATKVFKDGDLVEVDADKGVVRKIENSKEG